MTSLRSFSLTIALAAFFVLAPPALAAGPQWSIGSQAPTALEPGGSFTYELELKNVGDAETDGTPIEVRAELPDGFTAQTTEMVRAAGSCAAANGVDPVAGASGVLCHTGRELQPHNFFLVRFVVSAGAGASGTALASFEVSGGGGSPQQTVDPTTIGPPSSFGLDGFDQQTFADSGELSTQAAAHGSLVTTSIGFNNVFDQRPMIGARYPVQASRDIFVDLPPGQLGNPAGLPQCTLSDVSFVHGVEEAPKCPPESQVGTAIIHIDPRTTGLNFQGPMSLYSLVPPPNAPARFAFNVLGTVIVIDVHVRSDSDYGLSVSSERIPEGLATTGTRLDFWGLPSDPAHDRERSCAEQDPAYKIETPFCASDAPPRPFLRNPTACTDPDLGLPVSVYMDSWNDPADLTPIGAPDLSDSRWRSQTIRTHDSPGYPYPEQIGGVRKWGPEKGIDGCGEVPFTPEIDVAPTTDLADSPTGLDVSLTVPQDCWDAGQVDSICQSDLRDAEVNLPQGLSLNSAAASGLESCTPAQAGLTTPVGQSGPIHFDGLPAHCPDAAKIGSVSIDTPLLGANESPDEEDLKGGLYLASQGQNAFGSLLSIYLVAEGHGVVIKQAGEILIGDDGRLTTRFADAPQQPFTRLHLELFGGPRAALRTPPICGTYTSDATLTPWSGSGAQDLTSSFQITTGPGGFCPTGVFDPTLHSGTSNPLGGAYSPFTLRLTRPDGTEEIGALSATLPPGLLASLRGVPACSDAALASVSKELGTAATEVASPACPAASRLGTVTVGAGAGPTPFYTQTGSLYWAGPYKGAPRSIAAIVPALAGPFDLGSVVVRNAVNVDPLTTAITAVSDPLPSQLYGIPLDLRDVRIDVDRPQFTFNPTSCDQMAINADLTSLTGAHAQRAERFQAAGCDRLPFKPKLQLRLKGGTHRTDNPSLIATLRARPGDANIARAQVTLPSAAFLDNSHIKTICTRVQFAAQQCPPGSIYGTAFATSPILTNPLSGPVYLRSSSHELPDLVVALRGPAEEPIVVDLAGITDSVKGALRNTFEAVPDAPVDSFRLQLFGGKRGLIQLSRNLCAHDYRATVLLDGQNGKAYDTEPKLKVHCGGGKKGKRSGAG